MLQVAGFCQANNGRVVLFDHECHLLACFSVAAVGSKAKAALPMEIHHLVGLPVDSRSLSA